MSSVKQPLSSNQADHHITLMKMKGEDIDEISAIENLIYPFPWTKGNFVDSMASGYETWVAREASNKIGGYFFMMLVVDEAHLLNITVRADLQHKGIGRMMFDKVVRLARDKAMSSILLEVRPSNLRALALYERIGFVRIGLRKNYYPAANSAREDALVMRLPL